MAKVKKISLNKYGTLQVSRGINEQLTKLFCPFRKYKDKKTGRDECSFCGVECALFSEPEFLNGQAKIKICHNEFVCDESDFIDNRE